MPEETQKREFTGLWIPKLVVEHPELKWIDRVIYAEIGCFFECFMSNEALADRAGVTTRQVQLSISKLKNFNLIKQTGFDGRKRYLKTYVNLDPSGQMSNEVPFVPDQEGQSRHEPQFTPDPNPASPIDNRREHSPVVSNDTTARETGVNYSSSSSAVPTGRVSDRGTPTPRSAATPLPHAGAAPEAVQKVSTSPKPPKTPAASSKFPEAHYVAVLDHIRSVQHIEKEWSNYLMQKKWVKDLFTAGYSVEELTTLADLMAKDTYWKKNPFSAQNMVTNAHKYAARLKELTEEPPMTEFEIREEKRRATLELARQYDREHPRV